MTLLLLLGCVAGPGDEPLPPVDTGAFYAEVEPILGDRCSNPACHGTAERPLQVYAENRHRMDTGAFWLDAPLTPDEHAANLARARGFTGDPWLIARKALDPAVGGMTHVGGAVWMDPEDVEYVTLRAWAEGL